MDGHPNQSGWSEEDAPYDFEDDFPILHDSSEPFNLDTTPTSQGLAQIPNTPNSINPSILSLQNQSEPELPPLSQAYRDIFGLGGHNLPIASAQRRPDQRGSGIYPTANNPFQYSSNIGLAWLSDIRPVSAPNRHPSQDSIYIEPSIPRRYTTGDVPPRGIPIPADPVFQPQFEDVPIAAAIKQEDTTRKPRPVRNRTILPLPRKREDSPESSMKSRQARSEIEAIQRDAEGVLGWGWRWRVEGEPGPTFGETEEIRPLFTEAGIPVAVELHGDYQVSRLHAGKVSDDGGPLVHELQKRNIFQIRDMCYNLDSDTSEAEYLMLRVNDEPRQITRMFMKLVGRKNYGDSEDTTPTQLETRGKARQFKPARPVQVFHEMKYQKTDNGFSCHDFAYGDGSSLPDSVSETHMEFKHATSGNKTTGYWRVESQSYYRLALQLWAYTGDLEESSMDELHASEELFKVAESRTNLLIVRGRPPGGREAPADKPAKRQAAKPKSSDKGKSSSQTKRQKRDNKPAPDDDEVEWLAGPSQTRTAQGIATQSFRQSTARESRPPQDEDDTTRRYQTRKAAKRTYEEAVSDSNEQEVASDASETGASNESEYHDSDHSLKESQEPFIYNPDQTGNEAHQAPGDNAYQEDQQTFLPENLDLLQPEHEDEEIWRGEGTLKHSDSSFDDGLDLDEHFTWFEGYMDGSDAIAIPDPQDAPSNPFPQDSLPPPQSHETSDSPGIMPHQPMTSSSRDQQWAARLAELGALVPPQPELSEATILSNSDTSPNQSSPGVEGLSQDGRLRELERRRPGMSLDWAQIYPSNDPDTGL